MSIRFIFGRSGYGKTTQCLREIREKLIDSPQGSPLIYLVPEQMTFQSEKALATSEGISGMIRAQVYSFSRLAWKILQETGGLARTHLTSVGTNMLLRKIIEQHKHELLAFKQATDKVGFVEKTAEMIAEFKRYCIEPHAFYIDEETEQNKMFRDKLADLQLIYSQFERELAGQYVDSEDFLALLAKQINRSTYLKDAEIWIDGFHSFTPNEYVVLKELLKHTQRVTVTLTLESDQLPNDSNLHLFHENMRHYRNILAIAADVKVPIEEPIILETPLRFKHSSLAFIEKEFDKRPAQTFEKDSQVSLAVAVNRRAELEAIARKIVYLVREKHYRYRDISIIVRNLDDYGHLIETIFTDYHIPFFVDEKRPMLHHPLIELIRSIFEILNGNWRYEAIFRAIKTDLFIPMDQFTQLEEAREPFDQLENFVLKLGLQGNRWKNDALWKEYAYGQAAKATASGLDEDHELLAYRNLVFQPLSLFEENMRQARTGEEMAHHLYDLLTTLEIPEKMAIWIEEAEKNGELTVALEHEQAWQAIIAFLDEIVEIVGDHSMDLPLFSKLVDEGMESLNFSLVPPALDQVLIGSLDRSRYAEVKCAFLIGANEGILPAKPKEDGLLTEQEREQLAEQGIVLAPGSKRKLLDEQFYIYLALTTAEEKLWVSYPLADEEGKSLFPSPLITRLRDLFPNETEELWLFEPEPESDLDSHDHLFVTNPQKTLSILANQLRNWRRGYPISPVWWDVYDWFVEHDQQHATNFLINSLFYENKAKPLTKATSLQLYGEVIQVSVSRMERFQACPFQQFASHGLRLKERQLFRLHAPHIGQLFHDALSEIAKEVKRQQLEWASLSEQQCFELAGRTVDRLAPRIQSEILFSSNRHHYLKRKLTQVVGRATTILSQHAKQSEFVPVGLELGFGQDERLPPIVYELDNGTKLEVVGRIDRVDQAFSKQGMLLRIIDYKSSTRDVNLAEVYYGISMQMLTYLDVVLTHAPEWLGQAALPAGVLYFHVHDPMLQKQHRLEDAMLHAEIFKQFKMKGIVLADDEAISLMDDQVSSQDSHMIPVGYKKDGTLKKNSHVASLRQFEQLRSHVRHLTKTSGKQMSEGIIDISPYRYQDSTPCRYCEFKSVCQIDPALHSDSYRIIQAAKDEEIFDKIEAEKEKET